MRDLPRAASSQGRAGLGAGDSEMSESLVAMTASVVSLSSMRPANGEAVSASQPSPPDSSAMAASQPPVRLHVQSDGESGYVYRIVDALTGLLLAEVQRDEARNLDPNTYAAGALVSTRV